MEGWIFLCTSTNKKDNITHTCRWVPKCKSWILIYAIHSFESCIGTNHIICTMIFSPAERWGLWVKQQIPGCVESNCAADEFASKGKRGAGKLWQSLLPSSPTRVMHQNQFCISSPAAKTSLAFNPSSVSPSSRDANTQMIFSAMQCTTEWDRNDMRERSGLVSCTYYYSTQIEILVGTAQQKCKSLSIYFTL